MKQEQLDALAAKIAADKVCPALAETASQLVLGAGNSDADIVFIGEAPGKQEDLKGLPFVGASGKFLDEMLQSAGLDRSDVYITNIVKYRPPNNRDPLPEEKREFWPYLMRQIEIIQPRVVITLGRHSGMCFIPDLRISRDHGHARMVRFHDFEYLLTEIGWIQHDQALATASYWLGCLGMLVALSWGLWAIWQQYQSCQFTRI